MDFGLMLMGILFYAVIVIVLFLLTRFFWLWYFKLDKIEAHLAAMTIDREAIECGGCHKAVSLSFVACPYSEKDFRHCQDCKKGLRPKYKRCPYCGSKNIFAAAKNPEAISRKLGQSHQ